MMWEWEQEEQQHHHFDDNTSPNTNETPDPNSYQNFDFLSALSKPKDYYKMLEVDYDATEDTIRSNYIRLALVAFFEMAPGQTERPGFCHVTVSRDKRGLSRDFLHLEDPEFPIGVRLGSSNAHILTLLEMWAVQW
ncbi:uncharacterized protein [Cicer arietinum]|uniref:uncharacterized protein isoform X2 n=1 Tax=Cicer arietinum TaxID=3827 RepID=UPI003CC54D7C